MSDTQALEQCTNVLVEREKGTLLASIRAFLSDPCADRYRELDANVARLDSLLRLGAVLNSLKLEGSPQAVVAEWQGGGGSSSGGGASGGW
jgi:hypothetical protein